MDNVLSMQLREAKKNVSDNFPQVLLLNVTSPPIFFSCIALSKESLFISLGFLFDMIKTLFAEFHDDVNAFVFNPAIKVSHNVGTFRLNA